MAKERRARLVPVAAPVEDSAATAVAQAPGAAPRRVRHDTRASEHIAALYARIPAATKRRLDVATAMTGSNLSDVVTALLDEYVDPDDADKQAALQRLLAP